MPLLWNLQSQQKKNHFFWLSLLNEYNPHRLGLKIAIADCDEKKLAEVGHELTTIVGQSNVLVIPTDVSKLDQVVKLRDRVYETWGEVRNCLLVLFFFFCWLAVLCFFRRVLTLRCYSHVSFTSGSFPRILFHLKRFCRFISLCYFLLIPRHSYTTHYPNLHSTRMFAHFHIGCCAHEQCWDRQ